MENPPTGNELEHLPKAVVTVPTAELLQDPNLAIEVWSEENAADPSFLEQIDQHKERISCLDQILENLPDPTMKIEDAVRTKQITEWQAEKLYEGLSNLLVDEDYARLVLYLPFEFLPSQTWIPENKDLKSAIDGFRESYMAAWYSLLTVHDARANFVDGDVLETQLRTSDLPRVVKAAHLIPKLAEYGIMEARDAIDLLEMTDDELLRSNIADSLLVLDDMGLITSSELARINKVEVEDARLATSAVNPVIDENVTERRMFWLKQVEADKAIAASAIQVSNAIFDGTTSHETIRSILSYDETTAVQVFIEGIQKAVEQAALSGHQDARVLFESFKDDFLELWDRDDAKTKERLTRSFRRLYRLGVVDEEQLSDLGISLPKLAGPLSENLELMPEEINRLERIAASIESDPKLAAFIYPVVSMGGSRLKGYGEEGSDIDIGVFVRPGTPVAMKQEMRELIEAQFSSEGLHDEPIEFWLDENADQLKVHDFTDADPLIADSYWTHVLFGAAWIGNSSAVNELRKKLLPPYFYETTKQLFGRNARALYLERMEQDLLQYRLMHNGYERHYPPVTSMDSAHADLIDGQSMFWDSGYRRVATKLFIHMVFLPKIARS